MSEKETAEKVGYKYAFICNVIGLITASLILMCFGIGGSLKSAILAPFYFFTDAALNISVGIFGMFLTAYFFGKRAGLRVFNKKSDPHWMGIQTGIIILILGTFIGSLVGFFQEGLSSIGTHDDPFVDYLFKPLFWVTLFGILPVIIVGFWYGEKLNQKIKQPN